MKTDELIGFLARNAGAVDAEAVRRRFAVALGWGAFGSTLLMALFLGVRPDLAAAAREPMFWVKLGFGAAVAAAALAACARLGRPGAGASRAGCALAGAFVVIWLLALVSLVRAPEGARAALVMGATWRECLASIPLLAIPTFACALWAMKGLAPTRPALAGAAAGLLAGGVSALAYSLHCPELDAPFLAVWYALGMLIPAAAGAALGTKLLRW